ncbi:hypothetical protein TVAGG3_0916090 [Trichomonas vaginalis G3]|uniref:hypothetical protein n=1 Tax=Trichomonas vaginalis (strain ATCC PRA-98 / G3) TaxID=412133 RepID=UPI0021E5AB5B|nr:hypothetical protein TVAGG3_0916090 [Trichomonas vaginalis G3]KAI5484804.1 hypothetical protein TVAGG3_0916090 [Trichomonas vaginalis G3]
MALVQLLMVFSTIISSDEIKFKYNLKNYGRIFFGIITVPNSTRRSLPWDIWMKKVNDDGYHKAVFLSPVQKDYPDYYLEPPPYYDKFLQINHSWLEDRDRGIKRVVGVKYFVENTNFDWYWSLTDDVTVDIEETQKYIAELENTTKPRNEIVLKGHCICAHKPTRIYLQGGVGYLFGRYAAEYFNEKGDEWIDSMTKWDDGHLQTLLHWLKLSIKAISSHRFYGVDAEVLTNKKKFKICPENVEKTRCGYNALYPFKDVIAIHSNSKTNLTLVNNKMKELKENNQNIYYYFKEPYKIIPCRKFN